MDLGKVIRELVVEPDKELIPAPREAAEQKPAKPEAAPTEPAGVPS